eukprot:291366_1
MATNHSRFNSPFIYTTFAASDDTSIYSVYKQRIIDLYQQQYPSIKELSIKDINSIITNNKITQFKKQQQQQISDAKKQEKQPEENKLNNDNNDKKDDKKDNNNIPSNNNEIKNNEESNINTTIKMSNDQKKLIKALELLENEYFGNEHALYIYLCTKYKTKHLILDEYNGEPLNTIYDKQMEKNDNIICYECEEQKDFTQFDIIELNNGYFSACKECAPDRDSVKTIKWHPEWKAPSITLKEKDYVCCKTRSCHEGATTNLKPSIKNGQHCFRWLFKKHNGWILFGIAHPKKGRNNLYADQGVYGIASGSGCYKNGVHGGGIECHHLYQNVERKLIDMKVDLNKGEILYMEVDDAQKRIVKLTGIPKSDDGYNPCVSMYYSGHTAQVKKVPVSWFGKNAKRTKFKY